MPKEVKRPGESTLMEVALVEFDDNQNAVIMPRHEGLDIKLPRKLVYVFLDECIDRYADEIGAKCVAKYDSLTKKYPVYVTEVRGEKIAFCQAPVGAPAATMVMDWLIGYGCKTILASGCCGALEDIDENVFLVPSKALRDEGTSFHYAPPSRFIELDGKMRNLIKEGMKRRNIKYSECITWSTDAFYRETPSKIESRKAEGCSVVDMECSALTACARLRDADYGQIIFTADSLADLDNYDVRGWGKDSFVKALELCLDLIRDF